MITCKCDAEELFSVAASGGIVVDKFLGGVVTVVAEITRGVFMNELHLGGPVKLPVHPGHAGNVGKGGFDDMQRLGSAFAPLFCPCAPFRLRPPAEIGVGVDDGTVKSARLIKERACGVILAQDCFSVPGDFVFVGLGIGQIAVHHFQRMIVQRISEEVHRKVPHDD